MNNNKVKYIKRGEYSFDKEKFCSYAGTSIEEANFFLFPAAQLVENIIDRSLANHILLKCSDKTQSVLNLNYGPVKKIENIWKTDEYGNLKPLHINYTRLVTDKLYLPKTQYNYEIKYKTSKEDIGPLGELVIFKIAEKFLHGDKIDQCYIKSMLSEYKLFHPFLTPVAV